MLPCDSAGTNCNLGEAAVKLHLQSEETKEQHQKYVQKNDSTLPAALQLLLKDTLSRADAMPPLLLCPNP